MVNLSQALSLNVVVEGIGISDQLDHLKGVICEPGQGCRLTRTLTPKDAAELRTSRPQLV